MNAYCIVCNKAYTIEKDNGQFIRIDGEPQYICKSDWPGFNAGVTLQRRVMEAMGLRDNAEAGERRAHAEKKLADYNMTPRAIVKALNEYVIGQDRAKREVAVGLYDHHRIHQGDITARKQDREPDVDLEKANIVLIGPSGSGKTL